MHDHDPIEGIEGYTDQALVALFPDIPWGKALPVATPDAHGLACRFCLARKGLKAADVGTLPQDRESWEAHMREHHPEVLQ